MRPPATPVARLSFSPSTNVPGVMGSPHGNEGYMGSAYRTMQWSDEVDQRPLLVNGSASSRIEGMRDQHENYVCSFCHKKKKRECDLRKHFKRHTKPYGCTFPRCCKRFGSRNDWKRHESSQHFLQEMWKCTLPVQFGESCSIVLWNRDLFATHLQQHYQESVGNTEIGSYCDAMRLGANAAHGFWCGYCGIIHQKPEDLHNALEARFQHIGDHYDKQERRIEDWICVETNKPKGGVSVVGSKAQCPPQRAHTDSGLGEPGILIRRPVQIGYTTPLFLLVPDCDPGMTERRTNNTHINKRRRLSAEADAESVSDDEA